MGHGRVAVGLVALIIAGLLVPRTGDADEPVLEPTPRQRFAQAVGSADATVEEVLAARHDLMVAPVELGGFGLGTSVDETDCRDGIDLTGGREPRPLGAADLDGVAGDEVLTHAWEAGSIPLECSSAFLLHSPGVLAARGATGQPKWTVPVESLRYVDFADLTGDGLDDVITYEEQVVGFDVYVIRTRISARSGIDGSELWSQVLTSELHFAGLFAAVIGSTGLPVGFLPTDDADGDGVQDLVLQRLTFELAVGVLSAAGPAVLDATTVSGTTGEEVGRAVATAAFACAAVCTGGFPQIVPVGDLSGDGRADLLIAEPTAVAAAVSAADIHGDRYWQQTGIETHVQLVPGDVTGDGASDVVLTDGWSPSGALDGPTGSVLWRVDPLVDGIDGLHFGEDWLSSLVPDLDGDGGLDLVVERWIDGRDVGLAAISGRSGSDIWASGFDWGLESIWDGDEYVEHGVACDFSPNACSRFDGNGDGHPDLLFRELRYQLDAGWPGELVESAYIVVDGQTGDVTRMAPAETMAVSPVDGLVDSMGRSALLGVGIEGEPTVDVTVTFVDPGDLSPVGSITIATEATSWYEVWVRPVLSVDVHGDGPTEVALAVFSSTGSENGAETVVLGPDGIVWSI